MSSITLPPPNSVAAPLRALRGLPDGARVDRESRVIRGVSIIQQGALNDDRPWFADLQTLEESVALIKQQPKGLKSRFKHPNASNDGLGKVAGRIRNARLTEDEQGAIGDLHLLPIAFRVRSELGISLGEYILDLADTEPDLFGLSLAPQYDLAAMESLRNDEGNMPMRFSKLVACDVVDEPAATRGGLFGGGGELSIATAPHLATEALDKLFADATDDVIRGRVAGFLDNYLAARSGEPLEEEEMSEQTTSITPDQLKAAIDESQKATLSAVEKLISDGLSKLTADNEDAPDGDQPSLEQVCADERKRVTELAALATNAGLENAEKVSREWIEKGMSVDQAMSHLGRLCVEQNKLTANSGELEDDPDAKFKAEYRKNIAALSNLGISEEEYLLSQRIDSGAETLAPKTA